MRSVFSGVFLFLLHVVLRVTCKANRFQTGPAEGKFHVWKHYAIHPDSCSASHASCMFGLPRNKVNPQLLWLQQFSLFRAWRRESGELNPLASHPQTSQGESQMEEEGRER